MESLFKDPMVWIGIGAIILLVIVISLIISRRRKKELEELDQLFTDDRNYDDTDKISVEKVRRATLEREKRMEARKKELEQRKPRKFIPDEDQEIITNVEIIEEEPPVSDYGRKTPLRGDRRRSNDTLEVNMTTKIVTIESGNDDTEIANLSASRRLYKKNVLNAMSGDPDQQQTSPNGSPPMNNGFVNKSTKRR